LSRRAELAIPGSTVRARIFVFHHDDRRSIAARPFSRTIDVRNAETATPAKKFPRKWSHKIAISLVYVAESLVYVGASRIAARHVLEQRPVTLVIEARGKV
jgi:hypothetical protein